MSVKNTLGGFFFIGTKFYTYEDDNEEPTIYRLIRYKESKKLYSLKNIETKEIIRVNEEELVGKYSKYTRLNHDALMSFSIVEMPDKMIKDVVICIHPENENINSLIQHQQQQDWIRDYMYRINKACELLEKSKDKDSLDFYYSIYYY